MEMTYLSVELFPLIFVFISVSSMSCMSSPSSAMGKAVSPPSSTSLRYIMKVR